LRGVGREEAARRVDRWLSVFGLAERAGDAAGTYSLGMRRKLALTESFAAHADLLLFDEPLGGLDAEGRSALLASLQAERARGAAAVVAVHDPDFAAAACDTVILMDAGRVLTSGAPGALIESLALETTFDVTLVPAGGPEDAGAPEGLTGDALPDGVRLLGPTPDGLRLASVRGAVALPEAAAAVVAAGGLIRAIRVREPDLDDVFVSLTGRPLNPSQSVSA
jgi:ABC-type multidrug transport system ATPase subunit